MRRGKVFGFVATITLGILIALGGTALGLIQAQAFDKPAAGAEAKAAAPAAPTTVAAGASPR